MIKVNFVDKRADHDRLIQSGNVLDKRFQVDTQFVRVSLETDMGYRVIVLLGHEDLAELTELSDAYLANLERRRKERADKKKQGGGKKHAQED
jgi:hypothetical protein